MHAISLLSATNSSSRRVQPPLRLVVAHDGRLHFQLREIDPLPLAGHHAQQRLQLLVRREACLCGPESALETQTRPKLDAQAYQYNDNEAARRPNKACQELFRMLRDGAASAA